MFNRLNLSFREMSAWITLLALLGVYIPYFLHVLHLADRGELSLPAVINLFLSAVFLQVFLTVIAHVVISLVMRHEGKDERDQAVEARAFRNGYFAFTGAISITAIWMLLFSTSQKSTAQSAWLSVAAISQVLLFCFVLAEVTKYLTHLIFYRRGV